VNIRPGESKVLLGTCFIPTRNWNNVDELKGGTQNRCYLIEWQCRITCSCRKTVASIYAPVNRAPDKELSLMQQPDFHPLISTSWMVGLTNGYYGSGLYNYTMGLSNNFTYKSFSFSFSLDTDMVG
jgi:hypothetical protein